MFEASGTLRRIYALEEELSEIPGKLRASADDAERVRELSEEIVALHAELRDAHAQPIAYTCGCGCSEPVDVADPKAGSIYFQRMSRHDRTDALATTTKERHFELKLTPECYTRVFAFISAMSIAAEKERNVTRREQVLSRDIP